jgi:hypothetical protein
MAKVVWHRAIPSTLPLWQDLGSLSLGLFAALDPSAGNDKLFYVGFSKLNVSLSAS